MPTINPIGTENLVNTATANAQVQSQVTSLANGGFVVTWVDYILPGPFNAANYANADVKAQIFNADGTPLGTEFIVNNVIAGVQFIPSIIELSDGNILFSWQSGLGRFAGSPPAADPSTFMAREFTSSGTPIADQFVIGAVGSGVSVPRTTALEDGGFAAVWQTGANGSMLGQIFDSTNTAVGAAFTIDSTPPNAANLRVATLTNGNIVIAWNNAGGGSQAALRIFDANGVAVSAEIQINPGLPFPGQVGDIIALASGGFAVPLFFTTPSNAFPPSTSEGHVQFFFPDGTFGIDQVLASGPAGTIGGPSLSALPNGGVVASWAQSPTAGSPGDIQLQLLSPIGDLLGSPIVANSVTAGVQTASDIATLPNGDIVIAWFDESGLNGDISAGGIVVRRFDIDYTNAIPVAVDDRFVAANNEALSTDFLTDNDTDPDGDFLTVTAISNVTGGTVNLDVVNQTFTVTRAPGATGSVSFDYTISDGQGGTAVGQAVAQPDPNDNAIVRGPSGSVIYILANDDLPSRPDGYAVTTPTGTGLFLGGTGASTFGFYVPLASPVGFTYLTLPVGQVIQQFVPYTVTNPVTNIVDYTATVFLTLQGWAQTGGTDADNLVGGEESDHLIGGTGAANILTGGGGDDWYTVSVAGDQVIESAGGGTDRVLSALTTYVLPDNVEELQPWNIGMLDGTGNALNNLLIGSNGSDILAGLAGNDVIFGGNGLDSASYRLNTGAVYVDIGGQYAYESSQTTGNYNPTAAIVSQDRLIAIENVIGSAFGDRIYGTNADNVIVGGAGSDIIYAEGGVDTADYGSNAGAVYVDISASYAIESALTTGTINAATAQTSLDYLYSIENITGSAFGDRLYGTSGINIINGGAGNDIIYGNEGNDTLNGGDGDDSIIGGQGIDVMTGGLGADRFYFSTTPEPVGGPPFGMDTILDFTSGTDQIYLNRAAFGLGAGSTLNFASGSAANADPGFFVSGASLLFDADGTGAGAAVVVLSFGSNTLTTAADYVLYG